MTEHPDVPHFPRCPHPHARIRPRVGDRCCPEGAPAGAFRIVTLEACLACPLAGALGPLPPRPPKVGDVLAGILLERYGAGVTSQCDCASRIAEMNAWGPDGCEAQLETICDWLVESAAAVAGLHNVVPEWAQRIKLRSLIRESITTVREWTAPEPSESASTPREPKP